MITRVAVLAAVLLTALLLQTVVLPVVAVAGWRPDLVTLTVVAFALADGPETGARYGFSAGLASDLLSGGNHLVGLTALVLLLVGEAVGRLRPYLSGTGSIGEFALAAAAAGAAFALDGLLATLLDLRQFSLANLAEGTIALALWGALLAPLVCRPIAVLSRRYAPADLAAQPGRAATRQW